MASWSPAWAAWWTIRAASDPGRATRAARTARLRPMRRAGGRGAAPGPGGGSGPGAGHGPADELVPERHPFRGEGEQTALLGGGQDGPPVGEQAVLVRRRGG